MESYHKDLCVDKYDLISGISGNLYYILDCNFVSNEDTEKIIYIIKYLVDLSRSKNGIIGYFVSKFDLLTDLEKQDLRFKKGSLNFGIYHTVL